VIKAITSIQISARIPQNKMKIFATIQINENQVTQAWELIDDADGSILVIKQLENGNVIGILLDNDHILDLKGNELAKFHYPRTLDIGVAELIPRPGLSSN
jgi:hypothetical protein